MSNRASTAGRLTLIRHGESAWNRAHRFTGWADPLLTAHGQRQADELGRRLAQSRTLWPDVVYTSLLVRAEQTTVRILAAMPRPLPVVHDWRLNERHYGLLEGMRHEAACRRYGTSLVQDWRFSWAAKPPSLPVGDRRSPTTDPRYANATDLLPSGESLAACWARQRPVFEALHRRVLAGQRVLVVGHGNALRAMRVHLERIEESAVPGVTMPTGTLLNYRVERGTWALEHTAGPSDP